MTYLRHNKKADNSLRRLLAGCGLLAMVLVAAGQVQAQTVATYGFEDGTTQGWSSFNGASTPVSTTADAEAGTHSLLTTTAASGSGGPAMNAGTVLQAGAKYTITAYVKLAGPATAANANFTIKRTDTDGTHYDTIGSYTVPVSASGWAQIGGSYTVSQTETGLTLYAQLVGATSAESFYLDQVVITQTAPPPGGTPVASWNFSDGGTDGWSPFGSVTLASVASPIADPLGNGHSLSVTNRTATYMGPGVDLLGVSGITAGATYQVTAYVMLQQPDSTNPTISLSTKTENCADPSGSYGTIATSGAVSNTAWTKVQGTFSFSDVPGAPSSLVLYVQSSSATDSFYVSGVSITQLAPAPLSPDQQDNSGISSTFEDGGTDGWSGRGSAQVSNAADVAHTGSHSLLVTNRTANWNGPQINVSNKMYVGSVYNLSAWVMLQPSDGTNHILNMSLQTTQNGTTSYPSVTAYPGITVPADGQWHQISVLGYTMSSGYDPGQAYLYIQTAGSATDLVSFYVDDFQLTYVQPPQIQTNIPSIYQTLSQYFPVGAAVDMTDLTGPHAQLWAKHFNSMTPGNDLKWSSVEATKGQYSYANGDALVGLAVCHAAKVRGQNLVWATGQQTPAYAFGDGTNSSANQATVIANIQEHIQNEVQHFGTRVYAWDVVNEPIDPKQPDCLVHGPFYNVLGKSYLDVAFEAARQYAPPGTKLFLNEYSTADAPRLACLVKVVQDMQSRGVPIDGIGHEEHNNINYPSPAAIQNSIDTVAVQLPGLDQQITELDESVYNAGDTTSNYGNNVPPAVLAEQGWLYKSYFDVFRQEAGKLSAVTLWGMADDDTWLDGFPVARTDYPLPFDMQLQAKPAYWGIVDPTKLPGYGLTFSISAGPIVGTTETWTVTATNPSSAPAYTTQVNGFQLVQLADAGKPCSPKVTPGTFPVSFGDVPANGSSSVSFTVDFSGCRGRTQFALTMPWSSAVYNTGTFTYVGQYFPEPNSPNAQ